MYDCITRREAITFAWCVVKIPLTRVFRSLRRPVGPISTRSDRITRVQADYDLEEARGLVAKDPLREGVLTCAKFGKRGFSFLFARHSRNFFRDDSFSYRRQPDAGEFQMLDSEGNAYDSNEARNSR